MFKEVINIKFTYFVVIIRRDAFVCTMFNAITSVCILLKLTLTQIPFLSDGTVKKKKTGLRLKSLLNLKIGDIKTLFTCERATVLRIVHRLPT